MERLYSAICSYSHADFWVLVIPSLLPLVPGTHAVFPQCIHLVSYKYKGFEVCLVVINNWPLVQACSTSVWAVKYTVFRDTCSLLHFSVFGASFGKCNRPRMLCSGVRRACWLLAHWYLISSVSQYKKEEEELFLRDLWQIGHWMSSTRKGKGLYPSLWLSVIRRVTLVSGPGSIYYQINSSQWPHILCLC